jgi:hypothetical protein
MEITNFSAGLRVYQAEQQASFLKSLLSGRKTNQNNIFAKMNSDTFSYQPNLLSS